MKALEYSVAHGREFLARHDLLGHLLPEELDRLLASARAIRFPVSEPRSVTLKGIEGPVDVHTIDWQ